MKIALLGPYPPPYGGVSVHIERLKKKLEEKGIDCIVYDFFGARDQKDVYNVVTVSEPARWWLKYFFTAKEDVIHVHVSSWFLRAVAGLMTLLGKKIVVSIHGESLDDSLREGSWFRKQVIKFALKRTSFIITGNEKIRGLALSLGVDPQKVARIPAFILPTIEEEDYKKVPQYVWQFINEHKPVLSANAFRITFRNGIDVYGLDMIVELTARLKNSYQKLGVVFCLPSIGDKKYFDKLNQEIEQRGVSEHILFVTQPLEEAYPIWHKTDIFLRPTVMDGDALSVREALYFKTPVVTSDACPRPDGVILFRSRDIDSFTTSVEKVLANYSQFKEEAESIQVDNGFDKILAVYDSLGRRVELRESEG